MIIIVLSEMSLLYKVIESKLEVVPEEANIVKEIFHQYLYDGKGSTRIAKDLTERGIPTLNNRIWSPQHVMKILANDKYVGDLTQWKFYKSSVGRYSSTAYASKSYISR